MRFLQSNFWVPDRKPVLVLLLSATIAFGGNQWDAQMSLNTSLFSNFDFRHNFLHA